MLHKSFISISLLAIFVNVIEIELSTISVANKIGSKRYVFSNYWITKEYKNRLFHDKFQRLQATVENEKLKKKLFEQKEKEKLQQKLIDQKEEIKSKIFKEHLMPLIGGSIYKDFLTMRY